MRSFLKSKNLSGLLPVYTADLFFLFHFNSLIYINSSFLGKFFDINFIGFLYILGALGSIFLFFIAARLEKKFGNRHFLSLFIFTELISVIGLIFSQDKFLIALFFIILEATSLMIVYSLDIFLEDATPTKDTGSIRGIYLTLGSLTIVLSPFLIRLLAPNGEFTNLYILSALFLLPIFYLVSKSFKTFKDGHAKNIKLPIKIWFKSNNIRRSTQIRFTLDLFYCFMVIYMPIYLNKVIGFNWSDISIIFTIMLLPFLLFQIPLGKLADRFGKEKEFITLGLFIIGTALIIIPFISIPSIYIWAPLLFFSRVGASIIEVTTEGYFFKHVDKRDIGIISIYRLAWPVAIIIGILIVSISNTLFYQGAIFFILGLIMLKAMETSAKLKNTA